ncbi:DUF6968 family protein [Methylocystis heyeri]|uniref:DUF6968 domain-containing protein n=1 Tax=Methylocystis heyeri TaxID=391905 RepID=A0A6B8KFP9_9HYPH|nr:hypothetical protein [Methylocystis heyeri]QGM47156.1 hypothetical protein H2LOC_016450 [Methylocystis heyeri]
MTAIAEREFHLKTDPLARVVLSVEAPLMDGDDFRCDYCIEWPSGAEHGHAFGVDSLQALVLALQRAGADIHASMYAKSGDLIWIAEGNGLGLLIPLPGT